MAKQPGVSAATDAHPLWKLSDEDLAGLFRTTNLASAFEQLRSWQPEAMVLYTRGADVASLHIGDRQWSEPALRVNVVDTVGAGDASIAALLFSLMRRGELPPHEHLRFALAGGAAACVTAGATPPSLQTIENLLATQSL
ncbi:sugar/nucleoside kinase (ribokinase family) [Kinneretia asaccharophila]|uniref:Sugar/nucleoside kinase (Ribokinase family) n=1 Tax=Roseateles asaccharophilus TaxID=582607 RepID=A0ABU2ABK0_9BURK|nr:sugar/nucleoside kinase (ribokinase family) [Roseateles asaccharophilus]